HLPFSVCRPRSGVSLLRHGRICCSLEIRRSRRRSCRRSCPRLAVGPSARVQLVTTTPKALLPFVVRGAFLETLYYRLNVVYLVISGKKRKRESGVNLNQGG